MVAANQSAISLRRLSTSTDAHRKAKDRQRKAERACERVGHTIEGSPCEQGVCTRCGKRVGPPDRRMRSSGFEACVAAGGVTVTEESSGPVEERLSGGAGSETKHFAGPNELDILAPLTTASLRVTKVKKGVEVVEWERQRRHQLLKAREIFKAWEDSEPDTQEAVLMSAKELRLLRRARKRKPSTKVIELELPEGSKDYLRAAA